MSFFACLGHLTVSFSVTSSRCHAVSKMNASKTTTMSGRTRAANLEASHKTLKFVCRHLWPFSSNKRTFVRTVTNASLEVPCHSQAIRSMPRSNSLNRAFIYILYKACFVLEVGMGKERGDFPKLMLYRWKIGSFGSFWSWKLPSLNSFEIQLKEDPEYYV